ncbi:hypothetical protein CGCTS75_v014468 [Colletotrichum tropicale]|nr:hypothetical protein CGCTS75_v014468 [Colletotrichum tropicale]
MAEALGLASSIIAVADLAGKTISLSVKLKALWGEVKDVPVTLLEKAEYLQHLEELLDLAEQDAAEDATPTAIWNAINRARAARNDVQNTIDGYTEDLANRRRFRHRIAAAKIVLQKDNLRTVEQKLDRALDLYKLANDVVYGRYNRLIYKQLVDSTSAVSVSVAKQAALVDIGNTASHTSSPIVLLNAAKPLNNAVLEGRSEFGQICFGYRVQKYSFHVRFPDWLGGKVYSAMVQRSIAGWQSFFSVYPIVDDIANRFQGIIREDNVKSLQKYLDENDLNPLVHDKRGKNLLHSAIVIEALKIIKWLLNCGVYPGSFAECDGFVSLEEAEFPVEAYIASFNSKKRSHQVEILKLCQDYMPDTVEAQGMIWATMISERSVEDFTAIQMVIEPRYHAFDLFTRYEHVYIGVKFSDWSWHEVKQVLPEAETLTTDLIEICRSKPLCIGLSATAANGIARDLGRLRHGQSILPANSSFDRVLGDVVRLDPEDITYFDEWRIPGREECTALSVLLRRLLWDWHPAELLDQLLQSAITHWVTILYDSGVDLLRYGRKMRYIYQKLGWFVSGEGIWRLDSKGYRTEIYYTCSLLGITYGSLPEQWRLWWAPDINDYAADFWNLVEDSSSNPSGFNVPGGWADSFDEDSDDVHEEKVSFIWSEYRKIRPPI